MQDPWNRARFRIPKAGIFYICEYLEITPSEFFDLESRNPTRLKEIVADLKRLDDRQLDTISKLLKEILR